MNATSNTRIAFFLTTSGHSGVDRAMSNLIRELVSRGFLVDQLKIHRHGPYIDLDAPNFRKIELDTSHTYTALSGLIRYLRLKQPAVLLSDKDRVNRTALLAHYFSQSQSNLILRLGTTLSVNLANRGPIQRWIQRNSIRYLYKAAHRVITPSIGAAKDMASYTGLDLERIRVVPTPIIPDELVTAPQPRPDHPWFETRQPPVILSVGELSDRKDHHTLISAFAKVRLKRPCRLIILGKGNKHDDLLKLVQHLKVSDDVALPGYVKSPYNWMAHAGVFAFSSRWEGMPLVLAEALSMGTQVVSTNCPSGPAEILDNGRYGELVPVGDVSEMADAITRSLDKPKSPDFLREAALPYTVSKATDAYLDAMGLTHEPC